MTISSVTAPLAGGYNWETARAGRREPAPVIFHWSVVVVTVILSQTWKSERRMLI